MYNINTNLIQSFDEADTNLMEIEFVLTSSAVIGLNFSMESMSIS